MHEKTPGRGNAAALVSKEGTAIPPTVEGGGGGSCSSETAVQPPSAGQWPKQSGGGGGAATLAAVGRNVGPPMAAGLGGGGGSSRWASNPQARQYAHTRCSCACTRVVTCKKIPSLLEYTYCPQMITETHPIDNTRFWKKNRIH